MRTAFLVDGGFYLRRFQRLHGNKTPRYVARALFSMCLEHLRKEDRRKRQLYRIFYYDCPPLAKKAHNPVSGAPINFAETPMAMWRLSFLEELKKLRKVALRLGYLNERSGRWILSPDKLKQLLSRRISLKDLAESDVKYDIRQKGVDMRIGLDIASMAYKRQVDQIVLISGDSDFVPAAKLARREGIDFILDPMWASISADLHEHIDGLRTVVRRPSQPEGPRSPRQSDVRATSPPT